MRLFVVAAVVLAGSLLAGCQEEDRHTLTYIADGSARTIDVAFVAPSGIPAPNDSTFVPGDSTYTDGDTTFVLDVDAPWQFAFEAEDGERYHLRVFNRTERGHVSAMVYVDEDLRDVDGDAEPNGAAEVAGSL